MAASFLWSQPPTSPPSSGEIRSEKVALAALHLNLSPQPELLLNLLTDISHWYVGDCQLRSKCMHDSHVFEDYVEEGGKKLNQEENEREREYSHVNHKRAYEACFGFVCFRKWREPIMFELFHCQVCWEFKQGWPLETYLSSGPEIERMKVWILLSRSTGLGLKEIWKHNFAFKLGKEK